MSPLLLVFAVSCLAIWVAIVGSRWGRLLAVPAVGTGMLVLLFVVLGVTPFLGANIGLVALALCVAATAIGIVLLVRNPRIRHRPSGDTVATWLFASLGAVVWLASRAISQFLPGAAFLSWSMEGDTTNNLYFARRIIADHGILLGGAENPVPLPVGILALPMSLERLVVPSEDLLRSDITVFGWVWVLVIAAGCVTMGAVVSACVPDGRPRLRAVASATGSLLPLTWLVSGLPIDFGFFNVPFAIPLAMASWLAYLGARRSPAVAITTLIGATMLLLLTWSPVLLVPVALGFVVAVRERRALLAVRGWALALPIALVAVVALLVIALSIPTYFAQTESFDAAGLEYPSTWFLGGAIAFAGLLLAAALRTRSPLPVFSGFLAVFAAAYVACAGLLLVSQEIFDPWRAYYPIKFAWLATVVVLPIALSIGLGLLARIRRPLLSLAATATGGALVVGLAAFAPLTKPPGYDAQQPLARMLGGHVWNTGDEAAETILELSNSHEVPILWETSSPDEALINYWLMDAAGGALGGDKTLRVFSFKDYAAFRFSFKDYAAFRQFNGHRADSQNALCAVLRDPDFSPVIYTDNPELEASLPEWCEGGSARFVVGATPGLDD